MPPQRGPDDTIWLDVRELPALSADLQQSPANVAANATEDSIRALLEFNRNKLYPNGGAMNVLKSLTCDQSIPIFRQKMPLHCSKSEALRPEEWIILLQHRCDQFMQRLNRLNADLDSLSRRRKSSQVRAQDWLSWTRNYLIKSEMLRFFWFAWPMLSMTILSRVFGNKAVGALAST